MYKMNELKQIVENFLGQNSPVIIVNTMTDKALLCLIPLLKIQNDMIFMQFETLNERGGNSIFIKGLQGLEKNAIYLENEEENILMIQTLSLENYKHYIKPSYFDSPDFDNLDELKKFINSQEGNAW